mmetsp:Transcript_4963/g.15589  ORF Transcript_4963/g.15589 Transcript_4963/m.15589 type:complete len:210 (+) Transcript_4963:546-1175(+)
MQASVSKSWSPILRSRHAPSSVSLRACAQPQSSHAIRSREDAGSGGRTRTLPRWQSQCTKPLSKTRRQRTCANRRQRARRSTWNWRSLRASSILKAFSTKLIAKAISWSPPPKGCGSGTTTPGTSLSKWRALRRCSTSTRKSSSLWISRCHDSRIVTVASNDESNRAHHRAIVTARRTSARNNAATPRCCTFTATFFFESDSRTFSPET